MANSVNPDQTAPERAIRSGYALFAYAILSDTGVHKLWTFTLSCCFLFVFFFSKIQKMIFLFTFLEMKVSYNTIHPHYLVLKISCF